jgi:hypothetical protein
VKEKISRNPRATTKLAYLQIALLRLPGDCRGQYPHTLAWSRSPVASHSPIALKDKTVIPNQSFPTHPPRILHPGRIGSSRGCLSSAKSLLALSFFFTPIPIDANTGWPNFWFEARSLTTCRSELDEPTTNYDCSDILIRSCSFSAERIWVETRREKLNQFRSDVIEKYSVLVVKILSKVL